MPWDPVWDSVFASNEWGKYPAEELIRFVARSFYSYPRALRSSIKILEIGCGPGANLWFCAREGFTIFGIDGSQNAINRANQRLDTEVPGWLGQLSVGDISDLPYDDDYFDAVIDNEAVCCNSLEDSLAIYKETSRVLKPTGKLFVRTFSPDTYGYGTGVQIAADAFLCSEGPLKNLGYARFTQKHDLAYLLGPQIKILSCELLTITVDNQKHKVSEWIVQGEKV